MKLCKRGYLAAKARFRTYPSAYANAYAVQVCKGTRPDVRDVYKQDATYASKRKEPRSAGLRRWFAEKWVNVCEGNIPCSSRSAKKYPYCRPTHRISARTPATWKEMSAAKLKRLCTKKHRVKSSARVMSFGHDDVAQLLSPRLNCMKKAQFGTSAWRVMPLSAMKQYEKLARERGVSRVARGEVKSGQSARGFYTVYKSVGGDWSKMKHMPIRKGSSQTWDQRRHNFIARHLAQIKKRNEPLVETSGKYAGTPTRHVLSLIFWAYTPLGGKSHARSI